MHSGLSLSKRVRLIRTLCQWFFKLRFLHLMNVVFKSVLNLFLTSGFFRLIFHCLAVYALSLLWKGGKIYGYLMLANNSLTVCKRTITG